MQNKCIRFCLQFNKMFPISHQEFKDLNWLPASTRFEQYVISIVYYIYQWQLSLLLE